MRELLHIIVYPIFALYNILLALFAKPLHFNYSKNRGVEMGIVPLLVMGVDKIYFLKSPVFIFLSRFIPLYLS